MHQSFQPFMAGVILTFVLSALGCRHLYHYVHLDPNQDLYDVRRFHLPRFCFFYITAIVACIIAIGLSGGLPVAFSQYAIAIAWSLAIVLVVICGCALLYVLSARRWHEAWGVFAFLSAASGLLAFARYQSDGGERWLQMQRYAYIVAIIAMIVAVAAFARYRLRTEYYWELHGNQMVRRELTPTRSD